MTRRDYTPREYQPLLTNHIIDTPRCAAWAGMGLGKCVATLTALDGLFLAGETHPVLIMGPLRVARDTWAADAHKWNHLRDISISPVIGTEAERINALRRDASVFTCNYENLEWLVDRLGERWPFRTIVADEATRLKNFRLGGYKKEGTPKKTAAGSSRAKALARVTHTKVKRFIELTGTPSPNGLANLWGQMWYLDQGQRLGRTYDSFRQRWFQKSFDGYSMVPLPYAEQEIHDRLRDICLSIDIADYFDLDKPIVNDIYVDLPVKARLHYDQMEKDMFTEIENSEVEAFGAAARTQKCLQLANGAVYITNDAKPDAVKDWKAVHGAKLEALDSLVENANGMPQIVSYEFKSDAARIMQAFPGRAVMLGTEAGMKAFMRGTVPIGLAHPKSLGHGVDGLQDVTNIITFFGHNWDLELYDQIIGRIGPVRQMQSGHNRPVYLNRIIARDTVDELVMARRDTKRSVQDILMEAMKRR